jgi:hypothetical protein
MNIQRPAGQQFEMAEMAEEPKWLFSGGLFCAVLRNGDIGVAFGWVARCLTR